MAISQEQLKKLQNIKTGLEAKRQSEKGKTWLNVAKFVLPELQDPSERKDPDSHAAQEYTSLATNALQGWAYGRSIAWMHITREDEKVKGRNDSQKVKEWFQDVEKLMMDDLSRSGFYDEAQALTKIVLNLSTGIMLMDWDQGQEKFIVENLNPRRCCIAQNRNHEVDVLFHEFEMDKDQAEEEFGDKCPDRIRKEKDYTRSFTFVKAIFSSRRYDMDIDGDGEWCEVIWSKDEPKVACSERRMAWKPFLCWRFERSLTGSPWGVNSPGERCIGTIIKLNVLEKARLKGIQLREQPMIKATEGLEVNIMPFGLNPLKSNEDFSFAPIPGNGSDVAVDMQRNEAVLKEAYYVDFFLVLQQTMEQQKTATEAALLSDEKSQIMSSFTSRLNNEFLEVMLETLYEMELANQRLPEPPEDIAGTDIKIDFISPLTIAQRKAQTYAPARQFLAETVAFAEVDPSVKYIFDITKYAHNMSKDLMIDQEFIRSEQEVNEMVERDRQMAAQQMQMENAQRGAQTIAALGKAPEEGSMAQQMIGGGRNG